MVGPVVTSGEGVVAWRRIVSVAAIAFDAIFVVVLLFALFGAFLEQKETIEPRSGAQAATSVAADSGRTPPAILVGVIIVMIGGFGLNIVAIVVGGLPGSRPGGAKAIADEFS